VVQIHSPRPNSFYTHRFMERAISWYLQQEVGPAQAIRSCAALVTGCWKSVTALDLVRMPGATGFNL
jgi:hypothetical protein